MPKTILIVEDDDNLRNTIADRLSKIYRVIKAEDGIIAVEKIMDEKPHLVLLDLMLPKLDGFKVLERIRKYPDPDISKISVIVLSNLWSDKDILQAKALRVDDYFVKANTDLDQVLKRIQEVISQP